ncbi:hypothetical protein [Halostella litorea]|uniref:hypothetical protein n=1 Tax=Halostella litorea TaxID=2528831 RepID=UPI0010918920|nr:hypothetical protein [Halostella litorea]
MRDESGSERRSGVGRRAFLAGAAGVVGGVGAVAGGAVPAAAQEAPATRELVLEEQGEPWAGNYEGQIVIATYRPDREGNPAAVDNCEVDWSPTETELYNGILVDRLRQEPQKRTVDLYADATEARIERGTPLLISRKFDCEGEYIHLTGEQIPEDGLVRNASGPTVEGTPSDGTETETEGGDTDTGTGLPGFGALVGAAGVAGGLAARALSGADER